LTEAVRIVARVTSELQSWAGGVYDIGYRVVCCPKCRRLVVADGVAARDERLIRAKDRGHGWPIVALEIVLDHRHLFVKANWSDSPSRVANPALAGLWSSPRGLRSRCL
jgi:putative transposase